MDLVNKIQDVFDKIQPDIIFTHGKEQIHQDHEVVYKATMAACRNFNGIIICYPTSHTRLVKEENNNLIIDITGYNQQKYKILKKYLSQKNKNYFSKDSINLQSIHTGSYYAISMAEKFQIIQYIT